MDNLNSRTAAIQPSEIMRGNIIHRLAINQSAVIGSLYDAIEDRLLKAPVLDIPIMSVSSLATTYNPVIDVGILEGENLLDMIRIDKELCLSIYLNITASKGMTVLLKYRYTINKQTRYLSYYYPTEQTSLHDEQSVVQLKVIPASIWATTATHVVTSILSGIHVIVVLQLSPERESQLDRLLAKIRKKWIANVFRMERNEKRLFDQFTDAHVFSNIPDIAQLRTLTDVCHKITEMIPDVTQHRALEYTLRPIIWFFPSYPTNRGIYYPLEQEEMDQIEAYLYQLLLARKLLKIPVDPEVWKLAEMHFKQPFEKVQQQMLKMEELYRKRMKRSYRLILKIRRKGFQQDTFTKPLIAHLDRLLLDNVYDASDCLNALKEKIQLINDLKKDGIGYWNVKEFVKNSDHDLKTIAQHLVTRDNRKSIFCFDDRLAKPCSPQWNAFYGKLITARNSNSRLEFVYADFSFCSYQLMEMRILSSKYISGQPNVSREELDSPPISPVSERIHHNRSNPPTINFINVLLVGESGVGKSTFINALANYLTFDTLEQARSTQPIALMSVSFLMTAGDHFREQIVRFGEEDPNEDHNQSGQSVTQHCRSYVFTIDTQTKIRLIDTPGMGDTRGLDQDDRNMQHILSYINNLSHLNAICILLKPNEARLNVVLRSYFNRLLGFLGEHVRNNIVFCFTNTRATFYAPGNTGPLLKKMLESHTIEDIPFVKSNTFCFDSESFRYLIALENGIQFNDYQKDEYTRSWTTAVNESNRLLQYICGELRPYRRKDWQSMEHAYFQISQFIRPMLETIRNNLRNAILLHKNLSKPLIKLHPTPVPRNSTVCLDCKRPELLSEFWIIPDKLHVLSNRCNHCRCDFSLHAKADYALTYKTSFEKPRPSLNDMTENLDRLKQIITELMHFFKDVVRISKENDPILSALNQMIDEEEFICSQIRPNVLNSYLHDELEDLRKDYQNRWITSTSNQRSMMLPEIYKIIQMVSEMNTISEQLAAIRQTEAMYMTEQETLAS